MTAVEHDFLSGNFAPVTDERDDTALPVTGTIPPELEGLLVRNGPNPVVAPEPSAYHWFLGDGMLHGIELRGARARYRNRWVRTRAACEALGEDQPRGAPDLHVISCRANTHVVAHAGRLYALYEPSLPTEMRLDLSTVGATDFGGALTTPFTAHPKSDPVTGELVFFGYDVFGPPFLRFHTLDAAGRLARTEVVEIPRATMIHDFGVTATRVVWLDLPVVFDVSLVARQPFPFVWRPSHGARVGVMPRAGGNDDIVWIDIEPCYVFHPLNAYDDADSSVVMDVVRYDDMLATAAHGPAASSPPRLERWTIDPRSRRVKAETIDERPQELPRIDERFVGRVHRYGYTTEIDPEQSWVDFGNLRKHDLAAGTIEVHDVGPGRAAGEPVFAPAAPDAGEDEGWVLSVVYDATRDSSDLVIVDARDFTGPPVATVHLHRRVPFGFHGWWLPRARMA